MKKDADIVSLYSKADMRGKIELILMYYPRVITMAKSYEEDLLMILKYECEYMRKQNQDELGVRVQTSGTSDITWSKAECEIAIKAAIDIGNLYSIRHMLDVKAFEEYELELETLKHMQEDFYTVSRGLDKIGKLEAELLGHYLIKKDILELESEFDLSYEAVKSRLKRGKKLLIQKVREKLEKKYRTIGQGE